MEPLNMFLELLCLHNCWKKLFLFSFCFSNFVVTIFPSEGGQWRLLTKRGNVLQIMYYKECTYYHLLKSFYQLCVFRTHKLRRMQRYTRQRQSLCLRWYYFTGQIISYLCCNKVMLHSIYHLGLTGLSFSWLSWSEFQKERDWIFGKLAG